MEGTQPIWSDYEPQTYPALEEDLTVDVCVVGAGIAGLSVAYCLAREGAAVAVLEQRGVASGMTGRTTAHLSNAVDDRYVEIERRHGGEGARIAAESHTAAIDLIEQIVEREGIECAFTRLDGYLVQEGSDESSLLERELEAAQRAGLAGVERVESIGGEAFSNAPALRFARQAIFHPTKYIAGLAAAAERAGARIYCSSAVERVDNGPPLSVRTHRNLQLSAKAVVVATNSPINDRFAIHTKQAPYSTYAIAARDAGELAPALYWDTADPYHYVRPHTLADGSRVWIVGGEDHKAGHADDGEARFGRLEQWARERFKIGPITHRWSGQVMEPADGVAFIGRNFGDEGVYIATGDSGMGMTHGTIAGILLTDLIQGRQNSWAALYEPSRKMTSAPLEYAKENLDVAERFVADRLKRSEVGDAADLKAGQGAVLSRGLKKIAAYRDENGVLHECSAVCTHLGCIVQFNSVEKTWDCPCHGSRFDHSGHVIVGPAVRDLQ